MSDRMVEVKGRCPSCLLNTLFVGDGGFLTCSNVDCERPDAAHELIGEVAGARQHRAFHFCPDLVGHASMTAFAIKISQKQAAYADAVKFKTTLETVAAEVRMLCLCCGDNRERMRRIHVLLGLPTDDFVEFSGEDDG
ncbi:MAG: hypothetical protein HOY79_04305 [Streptomyces sp.]|nr:hypothetical protein [Streptomyces sp.]NUS15427.1 hypothetical protein [Streptomyces sp.]NUS24115.1 hypothetical protein [Streptomyces sp.]